MVGTVTLTIQGQTIGTVDLIAGSDVSRNQVLYTISRIGEFFSSTYFKVVIMLTMAVVAGLRLYLGAVDSGRNGAAKAKINNREERPCWT